MRALYARAHPVVPARRDVVVSEEWRLVQDELVGTLRTVRAGRDSAETTLLGPFVSRAGTREGLHWQQNRNGITYVITGIHDVRNPLLDRAWLAPDAPGVRLVGESVAENAYVVEERLGGGRRQWLYVDKRSGRLTRCERLVRGRRIVTTYDDVHTEDGIPEPFHVRSVDAYGNVREQTLIARTLRREADARDFEVPASRRLIEFPPLAAGPVRLPVRVVNGLLVARVAIDGVAADMLIDSGAAGIVLDPAVVERQRLETWGRRTGATLGTYAETATTVPSLAIGPLRLRGVVARVVPVPFRADSRTRIAGLLGFDVFADAIVHVDLDRGVVDASPPAGWRPPPDAAAVPLALDDKQTAARVRLDGVPARVIVDTGANRTVLAAGLAGLTAERGTTSRFRGVGGGGYAEEAHLRAFELGGIPLPATAVEVSTADVGGDDIDGVVGTDLLRGYELWFDVRAATLYARRARR